MYILFTIMSNRLKYLLFVLCIGLLGFFFVNTSPVFAADYSLTVTNYSLVNNDLIFDYVSSPSYDHWNIVGVCDTTSHPDNTNIHDYTSHCKSALLDFTGAS